MKVRTMAVALVLAAAAVPLASSPAQAVSCQGSSCEGKDPHSTGCDKDGTTVHEFTLNHHRLLLRRSKACGAVWATATPSDVGPADPFEIRSYRWEGVPPDHRVFRKSYKAYVGSQTEWTKMTASSWSSRACEQDLVPQMEHGDPAVWHCTAYT